MEKTPTGDLLKDLENVRLALDQSAIVAITDPQGTIIQVNDKFCEISKYSRNELIGQNHRLINSGYHSPKFFTHLWKTISNGQKWEGDIRNRSKYGQYYWVHTVIIPFKDAQGKIKEYVSLRYDITQKKQTEENLQNLFDSAFEGLLIYDLSGRVVWRNLKLAEVLGFSFPANEDVYFRNLFGKDTPLFQVGEFKIHRDSNQGSQVFELSCKNYSYQGHRAYLVATRDVSEKEKYEAQILQQDRMASIGLLASGLAHEIGTPLGVMRGRAELLSLQKSIEPAVRQNADIIIRQIDRISELIKSLLTLARGEGSATLNLVEINSIFDDVLKLLQYESQKYNIKVENTIDDPIIALAVPTSLFQVLLNLFVNSFHAIQERQSKEPGLVGKVILSAKKENDFWWLRIQDNGCGISQENIKKIFSPFFTTKDVGIGTGLGLAISFKMLTSWNGGIEVESSEGEGTLFSIKLRNKKIS
ncbi:MAG TPA: PAS domain-containing sensor histidine kinase [Pseudobdellovibrionaceae bacterium]|jgi:PAS domain S-box-containing protein